jgi:hypothetical protein
MLVASLLAEPPIPPPNSEPAPPPANDRPSEEELPFEETPPPPESSEDDNEEELPFQEVAPRLKELTADAPPPAPVTILPVQLQGDLELTELSVMALSVGAAPVNPLSTLDGGAFGGASESDDRRTGVPNQTVENDPGLNSAVQHVWSEMDAISENLNKEMFFRQIVFSGVVGSSTLASAGFALWTLRAGYFTAMLLTATPTWATLDVIPLLDFDVAQRRKSSIGGDELEIGL